MTLFFQSDDISQRIKHSGMSSLQYMLAQHRLRRMRLYASAQKGTPAIPPKPVTRWNKKQRESWERMILMAYSQDACDRIIHEAAIRSGYTTKQIKGENRTRLIVRVRHYVCWRISRETTLSLTAMGRRLGDRDHTTILHGIRRFQSALDSREPWAVALARGAK